MEYMWNMCENLYYESVYFKELHNDQEYYSPTIYRAGAAEVSLVIMIIRLWSKWLGFKASQFCLSISLKLDLLSLVLHLILLKEPIFASADIYDLWMIITCSKADIALCKGIRIPESAKFFLVESWIQQMFAVESGIPLMIGIWNPTNDSNLEPHWWLESGIQVPPTRIPESSTRNPQSLAWTDPECRFWVAVSAEERELKVQSKLRTFCFTFSLVGCFLIVRSETNYSWKLNLCQ